MTTLRLSQLRGFVAAAALMLYCGAVSAQVAPTKITQNIQTALGWFTATMVLIFTFLLSKIAVEISANHKRFIDVWHIVVGAGLAASAAAIAATFMN